MHKILLSWCLQKCSTRRAAGSATPAGKGRGEKVQECQDPEQHVQSIATEERA